MKTSAALALPLALALSAVPAHAASPKILNCLTPTTKPKTIVLACADNGVRLEGLQWTGWGTAKARAKATLVQKTCEPSCASGEVERFPATATAAGLKRCGDQGRFYTKLIVRRAGQRPEITERPCGAIPR